MSDDEKQVTLHITDGVDADQVNNTTVDIELEEKSRKAVPENKSKTSMHLRWKNICFDVEDSQSKTDENTKRILHSVSGQVAPGRSLAVLGPSGSGKTSLLNILSNRIHAGVSGDKLLNGKPFPDSYKRITGYVTQDDLWLESLTVRETLLYAAELKMANTSTAQERNEKIEHLVETLDMTPCIDTFIGKLGEGISGGERKRLAIGLELLSDPGLLFLDEPTSGLDSSSALMLAKLLKKLCVTQGTTVISTIHQPRFELLEQFDDILLLAQGKIVYCGEVDGIIDFFGKAGFVCPKFTNPADFVLDVLNTTTGDRDANIIKLHEQYEVSDLQKKASSEPDHAVSKYFASSNKYIEEVGNQFASTFLTQFWVVMRRSFMHKLREPIAVVTQAFNAIFMIFIVSTIYWQLSDSQSDILNITRAISLICLLQAFFAFDIVLLFPVERALYQREHDGGLYSTKAYYFGRSFAEMPGHILFAIIAANIAYWTIGFENDINKWLWFNLFIILVTQAGASCLLMCGALAKNLEQSNMIASLILILFMLFDGSWVSEDQIPAVYSWLQYLSFMGYGVKGTLVSQLEGTTFSCTQKELDTFGGFCPTTTGEQVLRQMGIARMEASEAAWVLVIMCVVYRFIAYLGLKFMFTGKPFKQLWNEN